MEIGNVPIFHWLELMSGNRNQNIKAETVIKQYKHDRLHCKQISGLCWGGDN